MANNTFFYNSTIFNYATALASQFSNLKYYKLDTSGAPVGEANEFSIAFGPVDSVYAQRKANLNETNEKYYQPIVKGGLILEDYVYSEKRAKSSNDYLNLWQPDTPFTDFNAFIKEINPTPFDFNFTLQIKSSRFEYATQIVEQISPYFGPQQTISVKELSYLNIPRDIKIVIKDYQFEFAKELEQDDKRYINVEIPISLEGFLYRPISEENIIKYIKTEYRISV